MPPALRGNKVASMGLEIKQGDMQGFFEAPFNAYGPNSHYVSPMQSDLKRFLDTKSNPLFSGDSDLTSFTAYRDGRAVGRITAHFHAESNALHGLNRGYFGYFDCEDNAGTAKALLAAAENWLQARGFDEIVGNFNLNAMQQIGVVTGGFDHAPYTDLVYSPAHIADFLAANGYTRDFPMTTYEVDLEHTDAPVIGPKQIAIQDNPDYEFMAITRGSISDRMEDARVILNASFAQNPMFVPVTKEEFHFQAKDMKWIMDPRISAILYYQGKPAATILCIPDLNPFLKKTRSRIGPLTPWHFLRHKMTCDRAALIFSGVIPELQGQGVNPLVLHRVITAMKDAGYKTLGNTWIGDSNKASLAQKEKAGARKLHRLHLFRKAL